MGLTASYAATGHIHNRGAEAPENRNNTPNNSPTTGGNYRPHPHQPHAHPKGMLHRPHSTLHRRSDVGEECPRLLPIEVQAPKTKFLRRRRGFIKEPPKSAPSRKDLKSRCVTEESSQNQSTVGLGAFTDIRKSVKKVRYLHRHHPRGH